MVHTHPVNITDFNSQLRSNGAYETDPDTARAPVDRLLGQFDTWYYLKILSIVVRSCATARRNRFTRQAWALSSFQTLQTVEACGGHVSIDGLSRLAEGQGPWVYVANHMSMLETFLVASMVLPFGDVATVVKQSLLSYPLFGPVIHACDPICVGRQSARDDLRQVIEAGEACLKAGRSVVLFPQSTRSLVFDPATFNSLGVKLARKAGVALVPVALKTDFQGIGRISRDFGPIDRSKRVCFRFGAPLSVTGNGREAHAQVIAFLVETLRSWGVRIESGGGSETED